MLFEFQNKTNFEVIGLKLMNLGFAFDSSDKDLWDVDLLDTDLDLLDTNIPNQNFAFLQDMSSRHLEVFKPSWRCLEDVFARHLEDVFKTFWNRLEDVLKTYDPEENICLDQDVLTKSWRRLLKTYN